MKVGQITTVEFFGNEKFAIGKIIQGGMGIVYQLVPIRANSPPVALKTLTGAMKIADFERECETWLSIAQHKNIARAFAFGEWEGLPAILVDWYPKSMAELKPEDCSNDYLVEIVRGIISALDFAYRSAGIVHQDIKPGNVLIAKDGCAKLSDFGLARCFKDFGREPAQWHDAGLTTTVLGPIGGTPFYMAPELFMGAKPSIKTDLFSLGATLYHFLTGEHPYAGAETKGRFLPELRQGPLTRLRSIRGPGITPVIELLSKCLSIQPKDRPTDYQATGWLDQSYRWNEITTSNDLAELNSLIERAKLYRTKGDFIEAENILRGACETYPNDPILLNALGALNIQLGQKERAFAFFLTAFRILSQTAGLHRVGLYLDPAINLAGQYLAMRRHSDAQTVLKTGWAWIEANPTAMPPVGSGVPSPDGWYCEFGWMFLYDGDFEHAAIYLANALSVKGIDKAPTYWLVEAAWLSNRMKEHADFLAGKLAQLAASDPTAALCACLVAQFTNRRLKRVLMESISSENLQKISKAEHSIGLDHNMLLYPTALETQKAIIQPLDDRITGGKHFEYIRQITEPRMA